MARNLDVSMQSALRDAVVRWCWLIEMQSNTGVDVVSGYLRVSSLSYDKTWNSLTWYGNGMLKDVDGIEDTTDHSSGSVKIVLSGAGTDLLSLALQGFAPSHTCQVYFAMLDANDDFLAEPYLIFSGVFDEVSFKDDGSDMEIEVSYTSGMEKLTKINVFRFTHESQQALFQGDLGFQYVSQTADWSGFWGTVTVPKVNQKLKRNSSK